MSPYRSDMFNSNTNPASLSLSKPGGLNFSRHHQKICLDRDQEVCPDLKISSFLEQFVSISIEKLVYLTILAYFFLRFLNKSGLLVIFRLKNS